MDERITRSARYWAGRTGSDPDEIASIARLRVAELLLARPDLADEPDCYLVKAGINSFLGECRHHWRLTSADSFDDLSETIGVQSEEMSPGEVWDYLCSELGPILKPILVEIARAIDDPTMIKASSGQINVSALAKRIGLPRAALAYRFAKLQAALEPMLAGGVA